MARGQSQAAQNQLNLTNSIAAQQGKEATNLENQVVPGYTSLMNTGYLSPEEEAAATTSEMGSAAEPFQAAGFQAANRAGATHNASDLTSEDEQLALDKGRTMGEASANLQNQKMQNQEAGMYGLSNLFGENLKSEDSMYGLGPGTLQARAAGQSGDQTALGWAGLATGQGAKG